MSLTILSVAYPFSPVAPDTAGGAEQILATIDRALTSRGDRSLVVACDGSRPRGTLYPAAIPPSSPAITADDRLWAQRRMQAAIDRALGEHPVDLIHMHGLDFAGYILPPEIPVLVTLHLPIAWYGDAPFQYRHPRLHLCCVSQTQRSTSPLQLGAAHTIENGVCLRDPPSLTPISMRENFALVLGRICPEKNQHAALLAGTRAGVDVVLAGNVFPYPEHIAYFEEQVRPLLGRQTSGVHHRFVGPVGPEERTSLFSRARCLLHPTLAPETSSLVAMEALAAGTPVVAFRSGALPEIVAHPEVGLLVDPGTNDGAIDSVAQALGQLERLSPIRCREHAEARFGDDRMVRRYLRLYQEILSPASELRYA
jgi:glycosyltransferase involved in cell wall biosynthesis